MYSCIVDARRHCFSDKHLQCQTTLSRILPSTFFLAWHLWNYSILHGSNHMCLLGSSLLNHLITLYNPQGSVLGPLLCILCPTPLSYVIKPSSQTSVVLLTTNSLYPSSFANFSPSPNPLSPSISTSSCLGLTLFTTHLKLSKRALSITRMKSKLEGYSRVGLHYYL